MSELVKINTLVFDMDDTLVDTNGYIEKKLRNHFIKNQMLNELNTLDEYGRRKISSLEYDNTLRDLVFNIAIKDGDFAILAEPSKLVNSDFYRFLDKVKSNGTEIHICTHRGFLKDGGFKTHSWLHAYHLDEFVDKVHLLKSKDVPDKTVYLDEVLKGNYRLIDDNPLHDLNKKHPLNTNLVVYNGINKFDAYKFQYRTDDPTSHLIHYFHN